MECATVINRLLRADARSRTRSLRIRTYTVLPLNEECGLIEWVQNTDTLRSLLARLA